MTPRRDENKDNFVLKDLAQLLPIKKGTAAN